MDRIMKKSVLIILSLMILSPCLAEMSALSCLATNRQLISALP